MSKFFVSLGDRMFLKSISIASVIGVLGALFFGQVFAQTCETERQAVIAAGGQGVPGGSPAELARFLGDSANDVFAEIEVIASKYARNTTIRRHFPNIETDLKGLQLWALSDESTIDENLRYNGNRTYILYKKFHLCLVRDRIRIVQAGNSSSVVSAPNSSNTVRAPPPAPVSSNLPRDYVPAPDVRRSPNPLEGDAVALSSAVAYAQKRQSDVDRAREGKPKRHKSGAEAHNCLKPQPGGGVVNNCPFAVEYHYCVYHPTKDSWSASFDCEKTGGGSWQIGPGPNSRSILHTAGEMTYWFACRYGETLSKPDGISPVDIEFQRGRGLVGRCGEWGSSRG